jgi:hypothetical protein
VSEPTATVGESATRAGGRSSRWKTYFLILINKNFLMLSALTPIRPDDSVDIGFSFLA